MALRLRDKARPEQLYLPAVRRELAEVAQPLKDTLRAVCLGKAPWPLLLFGPAGVGKTCAALAVLDYTFAGIYFTAAGLAQTIIDAQQQRLTSRAFFVGYPPPPGIDYEMTPDQVWQSVARRPLVVLDELGVRSQVSDHHYECVKRLLDERQGKAMIAISNLPLSGLERLYDDRIASRLAAGTVLAVEGPDRRLAR